MAIFQQEPEAPASEPLPRPERVSRSISEAEWASLPPTVQRKVAATFDSIDRSHKEQINRLSSRLQPQAEAPAEPAPAAKSNGNGSGMFAGMDDGAFYQTYDRLAGWYDEYQDARASGDEDKLTEIRRTLSEHQVDPRSLTTRNLAAFQREAARREAAAQATTVEAKLASTRSEEQHSALLANLVQEEVGRGAFANPEIRQTIEETWLPKVASMLPPTLDKRTKEALGPLVEAVSWLLYKGNQSREAGPQQAPAFPTDGFPRPSARLPVEEDPKVVSLRAQGRHRAASKEKLKLFLRNSPQLRGRLEG